MTFYKRIKFKHNDLKIKAGLVNTNFELKEATSWVRQILQANTVKQMLYGQSKLPKPLTLTVVEAQFQSILKALSKVNFNESSELKKTQSAKQKMNRFYQELVTLAEDELLTWLNRQSKPRLNIVKTQAKAKVKAAVNSPLHGLELSPRLAALGFKAYDKEAPSAPLLIERIINVANQHASDKLAMILQLINEADNDDLLFFIPQNIVNLAEASRHDAWQAYGLTLLHFITSVTPISNLMNDKEKAEVLLALRAKLKHAFADKAEAIIKEMRETPALTGDIFGHMTYAPYRPRHQLALPADELGNQLHCLQILVQYWHASPTAVFFPIPESLSIVHGETVPWYVKHPESILPFYNKYLTPLDDDLFVVVYAQIIVALLGCIGLSFPLVDNCLKGLETLLTDRFGKSICLIEFINEHELILKAICLSLQLPEYNDSPRKRRPIQSIYTFLVKHPQCVCADILAALYFAEVDRKVHPRKAKEYHLARETLLTLKSRDENLIKRYQQLTSQKLIIF